MTTIQTIKTDGNKINFNFKLENGLPYKPFIGPDYGASADKEDGTYDIYANLNLEEMGIVKSFQSKSLCLINNSELWLELEHNYVVFTDLSEEILKNARASKIRFLFFDDKKEFICAIGS